MRNAYASLAALGVGLVCLLSSCSSPGPAVETRPAEVASATPTPLASPVAAGPSASATPGASFSSSPTPDRQASVTRPAEVAAAQTLAPTLPAETAAPSLPTATPAPRDCVDRMTFAEDVTIPDHTIFDPGEVFTKTWRIYNSGNCTWDDSYRLVFEEGDPLGGPMENPIPAAVPGEAVEVSVRMAAPPSGGEYVSYWKLRDYAGRVFGAGIPPNLPLWAIINTSYYQAASTTPVADIADAGQAAAQPLVGSISQVSLPENPTQVYGATSNQEAADDAGEFDDTVDDSMNDERAEDPRQGGDDGACNAQQDSSIPGQIVALVNAARQEQGLSELSISDALTNAARLHSLDMACSQNVSHTGSDGSSWGDRVRDQGYSRPSTARENIYAGSPSFGATPQGTFNWWMGSPVHHDNILWPSVTDIGVGYASYNGTAYYTLVLASP